MSAVSRVTGLTRAETCARISTLRGEGLTAAQIAAQLGLSTRSVENLIYDPDGSKQRERRSRYQGTCSICGKQTDGSNGHAGAPSLCAVHAREKQHLDRHWTPQRITRAFKRFHKETGRPPRVADTGQGLCESRVFKFSGRRISELERVVDLGLVLPSPDVVSREFGSWNAAIEAAGMAVSHGGGGTHRATAYYHRIDALERRRNGEAMYPTKGKA